MKDETLLPCPFCGGSAYHEQSECGHFIACEQCGCGTDDWTKADLAITAWNKRAASAPKKANSVMPDYEGIAMTQRECYQAGLEAGIVRTAGIPEGVKTALSEAVAAIHFTDSSDYLPALFAVVKALSPTTYNLLLRNPKQAFDATRPHTDRQGE